MHTERWQLSADGKRYTCKTHGAEFDRLDATCLDCITEGDAGGEVEHDAELAKREAEWLTLARYLVRKGKALIDEGTAKDIQAGAKAVAEATKLHRMAADIRDRRSQRQHERDAIEHERVMSGLRASH